MWNRDPGSPSYGSFDRMYWGWKYKDFSDATLQYAVRLAVAYAAYVGKTGTLPELLNGFAVYCSKIQHQDGSFDQCYPNERSPGVLYDFLSTLVFVRTSPLLDSEDAKRNLDVVMQRGVAFLLRTDETHGHVANHTAQYAFELLNYAAYSGDDAAKRRGDEYLERTLSWLDPEEGWFLEYEGADTGYQTRTLRYLAKIALLSHSEALWKVIAKAAGFVERTLAPDGSVHPMLGCRSTALLYPSAFELLAARDPAFDRLAARVRAGWEERRVPLPTDLDFVNAIRLGEDALDAASVSRTHKLLEPEALIDGMTVLPNAGLIINRCGNQVTYVSTSLGGTIAIYRKLVDGKWEIAYEDSGYLVESIDTSRRWLTRVPGSGTYEMRDGNQLVVRASFYRSLHDEMSPPRMIVLRLLNLTLLRFQPLADLFRKLVVRRLMLGRETGPWSFERRISFEKDAVRIHDVIGGAAASKARLYRCRRITGVHMASSRYFQDQELETPTLPWRIEVAESFAQPYEHTLLVSARPIIE